MSLFRKTKSENLHLKIAHEDKSLIQHAARHKGYDDVSDYIRSHIIEIAKNDLYESGLIHEHTFSEEDWMRFKKVMEDPEEINENLLKVFQKLEEIESSSEA